MAKLQETMRYTANIRNIFMSEKPSELIKALNEVINNNEEPKKALNKFMSFHSGNM